MKSALLARSAIIFTMPMPTFDTPFPIEVLFTFVPHSFLLIKQHTSPYCRATSTPTVLFLFNTEINTWPHYPHLVTPIATEPQLFPQFHSYFHTATRIPTVPFYLNSAAPIPTQCLFLNSVLAMFSQCSRNVTFIFRLPHLLLQGYSYFHSASPIRHLFLQCHSHFVAVPNLFLSSFCSTVNKITTNPSQRNLYQQVTPLPHNQALSYLKPQTFTLTIMSQ